MDFISGLFDRYIAKHWDVISAWLLDPQAWMQIAVLLACYGVAWIVYRKSAPSLVALLKTVGKLHSAASAIGQFIEKLLPLFLPLIASALASITAASLGAFLGDTLLNLGARVFLFLAIRALATEVLKDNFLRLWARMFLLPFGFLFALGLWPAVSGFMATTFVPLGNLSFSLLAFVQFIALGGLIFWLGSWSNTQSSAYIENQKDLRPSVRQLSSKAAEMMIFGGAFLVFMSIMEIPLSTFAVLGGAIGVGLGFGLQKIASNFISGVILMLEGQATVGDYVELDGGEAGTIVKMTARAAFLETFDGKWIVVPNEDFIITRVINYSDSGSANRYEADFFVSYDTDINLIPDMVEAAVAKHPDVLSKPFPPDCELRGFGDSGVKFAVEFWVNGIDDGANKFTSDVLFIIWNVLKDNNIEIPFPQRVVHHKGLPPQ